MLKDVGYESGASYLNQSMLGHCAWATLLAYAGENSVATLFQCPLNYLEALLVFTLKRLVGIEMVFYSVKKNGYILFSYETS